MSAEIPVVLPTPYFMNEGFSRGLEPKLGKVQFNGYSERISTDYCPRENVYMEQIPYPTEFSHTNLNTGLTNSYNPCCEYLQVSQYSNTCTNSGLYLNEYTTTPQPVRMMCSIYIDPGCGIDSLNSYNQGKLK